MPKQIQVLLPTGDLAWVAQQPTVATFAGNPVPPGVFEADEAERIAAEWDAAGCLTEVRACS